MNKLIINLEIQVEDSVFNLLNKESLTAINKPPKDQEQLKKFLSVLLKKTDIYAQSSEYDSAFSGCQRTLKLGYVCDDNS